MRLIRLAPPIAFVLAAGLLTVWLAIPRLASAIHTASYDQTFRDLGEIRRPREIGSMELALAAESRREALSCLSTGAAWAELGAAYLIEAAREGYDGRRGQVLLERSIEAHRQALVLEPGDSYVWTRLAHTVLTRDGPTPGLALYLRMAILTAPREPKLVLARLDLAFVTWHLLDNSTRALLEEQIVIVAGFYAKRLARLTKERFALGIVRPALASAPRLLRRFDAYYRQA